MSTLVVNLRGAFTCQGFVAKGGRHPVAEDAGFLPGPLDLAFDGDPPVLTHAGTALARRPGDRVIDGVDHVALPGWIDGHTHALYVAEPSNATYERRRAGAIAEPFPPSARLRAVAQSTAGADDASLRSTLDGRLRRMRRAGVAGVEVKSGFGCDAAGELRLLQAIRAVSAGPALGLPDLRSTFLGLYVPDATRTAAEVVDDLVGVLPRIMARGLADFVDACTDPPRFAPQEAVRFLSRARHYRLPARVHCTRLDSADGVDRFTRLGVVAIDGLRRVAQDAVPRLARHGCVCTMLPSTALMEDDGQCDARGLIDGGVTVALASDAGATGDMTPGFQTAQLLAATLLSMSPAEILCASTVAGAQSLQLPAAAACITVGFPLRNLNLWRVMDRFADARPETFLGALFLSHERDAPRQATPADLHVAPPRRRRPVPGAPGNRDDHEDGV